MSNFAAQFNPFAYQTAPLRSIQFGGQEYGTPIAQPEAQPREYVEVARPVEAPSYSEDLNEDYDPNFVKNALAYGSQGRSSVNMPVVNTDYSYAGDDSDFRGKGAYCIA